MAPIINVMWEHHQTALTKISLLTTEVNRQNARITSNQITLAEIQQQLADGVNAIGGGGGMEWPLFKGAMYYRFTLTPNVPTKIVESLPEPQLRQLRFRLLSGTECYLSYDQTNLGSDWNPLQLNAGMLFQDDHDGGNEVWALSPLGATILIEIRTAEQANNVGEDFVIPFKAEPVINASPSSINYGHNRLKGFVGDNSTDCYRALDIQSFHPGQSYNFNIEVDPAFAPWLVDESTHPDSGASPRYGNKVIEVYAPNLYANLPEIVLSFFHNNADTPVSIFDSSLFGVAKRGGWVTSLGKDGGNFTFTPDLSRRFLFFFARVSEYEPGDFGTGYAATVTFKYEPVTRTITIVGV